MVGVPYETPNWWDSSYGAFHKWGAPKWLVYNGKNPTKMDDLGVPISGNPHISKCWSPRISLERMGIFKTLNYEVLWTIRAIFGGVFSPKTWYYKNGPISGRYLQFRYLNSGPWYGLCRGGRGINSYPIRELTPEIFRFSQVGNPPQLSFFPKNPSDGDKTWLVVWNINFTFFIFPYIGFLIIPIDSYFSEGWPNHQPETIGVNCPQELRDATLVHRNCTNAPKKALGGGWLFSKKRVIQDGKPWKTSSTLIGFVQIGRLHIGLMVYH